MDCLTRLGPDAVAQGIPPPHEPCGDESEQLWVAGNDTLRPLLSAIEATSTHGSLSNLFENVDCMRQTEEDFARTAHFASMVPRWLAGTYLACAVRRTAHDGENFALWSMIDAAQANVDAVRYLADLEPNGFADPRTTTRVRMLRGEAVADFRAPRPVE